MSKEVLCNTKLGPIKGVQSENKLNGKDLFTFKSIPYAAIPTGNLRFRPPQPHPGWNGVLDGTKDSGICAQNDLMITMSLIGSDDCLYLNIFTSNLNPTTPRPVMVFIHGGGFTFGHSSTQFYGPDIIVQKDVILVTVNYRLNIFGFLNLGIEECPGNVGLKDQIAALRWIQDNIESFGGDKNNVTLFGESAGAASVHYLIMAASAKDLFHKAILQSGSALDEWAYQLQSDGLDMAISTAKTLGCESKDHKTILEFLKSKDSLEIVQAVSKPIVTVGAGKKSLVFPFVPSIETVGDINDRIVTDHPWQMIKSNIPRISIICGQNSQESLIYSNNSYVNIDSSTWSPMHITSVISNRNDSVAHNVMKILEPLNKDFESVVPDNLSTDQTKSKLIANDIRRFYFGEKPINGDSLSAYFDMKSDLLFTLGHYETVSTYSNSIPGQAYVYLFSFTGDMNFVRNLILAGSDLDIPGASHVDELGYLFYNSIADILPDVGSKEEKVCNNMCTLWTNFAKHGVPSTENFKSWTPCKGSSVSYLDINTDLSMKQGFIFNDRYKFWNQLYSTYRTNYLKEKL